MLIAALLPTEEVDEGADLQRVQLVAAGVAAVILAVPLLLALASARGWISEERWRRDALLNETWLDRHWWVLSLVTLAFMGGVLLAQLHTGDRPAVMQWLLLLWWTAWPYMMRNERRRLREELRDDEARGVSLSGREREPPRGASDEVG